jgi:prepilin-type N-terminal cleavage/methylation domain-containing protein/prepilin-type processing-associated H-X9-DG protein
MKALAASWRDRRPAFSLIELVVVIAILGIAMGLLLVAVQRIRGRADQMRCAHNLREIAIALHNYHATHAVLPPGCTSRRGKPLYPFVSWVARLTPYIERNDLWQELVRAYQADSDFLDDPPHSARATVVTSFLCPSDSRDRSPAGFALLAYLGVEGRNLETKDGVFFMDSAIRMADITDGASNTLLIGERPPSARMNFGWWYAGWGQNMTGSVDMTLGAQELNVSGVEGGNCEKGPYSFSEGQLSDQCDAFHFWSLHPGGANFAFADGSVRFLSYSAESVLPALATRSGGEAVTDW